MSQVKIDVLGLLELLESKHSQAKALVINARYILSTKESSLYIHEVANQLLTSSVLISEADNLRIELHKIIVDKLVE
ncbi:hypothetical protein [Serratia marcescens]|uniref:hypothetical protein n=1 Tax=Serratia marcescens TaxID=615 RepID=UPI000AAAB58C|nr:hypothetical protein [Serratia marcescens]